MERQAPLSRGLNRLRTRGTRSRSTTPAASASAPTWRFAGPCWPSWAPEPFPPELDAGTPTESGGDYYVFARTIAGGHRVVYEPDMFTFHQHRPDPRALHRAVRGYGVGCSAAISKLLVEDGELETWRASWWLIAQYLRTQRRRTVGRADTVETRLSCEFIAGWLLGPRRWRRLAGPAAGDRGGGGRSRDAASGAAAAAARRACASSLAASAGRRGARALGRHPDPPASRGHRALPRLPRPADRCRRRPSRCSSSTTPRPRARRRRGPAPGPDRPSHRHRRARRRRPRATSGRRRPPRRSCCSSTTTWSPTPGSIERHLARHAGVAARRRPWSAPTRPRRRRRRWPRARRRSGGATRSNCCAGRPATRSCRC